MVHWYHLAALPCMQGSKGLFDDVEFFVLRGYSDLEVPVGQIDGRLVFHSSNSSNDHRLIRDSAVVLDCDIVSRD